MDSLQALTLAFVQGVTEFLPISSSAHLILVPYLFGWADQGVVFDIAVHVGTLGAVMLYFWRDVRTMACGKLDILRGRFTTHSAQLVWAVGLATLPLIALALVLSDWSATMGRSITVLATTSIVFGLLLWVADWRTVTKTGDVTLRDAFWFGCAQALAIIPGTSRSGICVTAGRLLGYGRAQSGRFASLMAMPTIALAGLYSLLKTDVSGVNWSTDASAMAWGMAAAFMFALAGIHVLMTWSVRLGYWPYMVYRVVLGAVLLAFVWG